MLIVIEGFDGCGKDTVARAVARFLGCPVQSFPDDSSPHTGAAIRSYLKREWHVRARDGEGALDAEAAAQLGAKALQSLALANRLERFDLLANAVGDGENNLVCARYWPSGWVYGQLDGLDRAWIDATNAPFPDADLAVLLDLDPETCLARRQARDGQLAPERYEGKLEIARRGVELYRELWNGRTLVDEYTEWRLVDASQPVELVVADVLALVRRHS